MITGTRQIGTNKPAVTGVFNMTPVEHDGKFLINPTREEADAAGIDGYIPESYKIEKGDYYPDGGHQLSIWLQYEYEDHTYYIAARFNLSNDQVQSKKTGRYNYVNKRMQLSWATDPDEIAEMNTKIPDNRAWMRFSLIKEHAPKILKKGEIELMMFLTSLGRYSTGAKGFQTEYFDDKTWAAFLGGDFSFIQKQMARDKKELAALNQPFGVAMGVGVGIENKRQALYQGRPGVNSLGDMTPYLHWDSSVEIGSKFDLALRNIKWADFNVDKNTPDGEYSFRNKNYYNHEKQTVIFKSANLNTVNVDYDEVPEVSDDISSL